MDGGLVDGDLDHLPVSAHEAAEERHVGPDGGVGACQRVGKLSGRRDGRRTRLAGLRHHAAEGEADHVTPLVADVRPRSAEVRDAGVDEAGVLPTQRLVGQPAVVEIAGGKGLDHGVGGARQAAEQVLTAGRVQVQRHAPLVAVVVQEVEARIGAGNAPDERRPRPDGRAAGGLDPNDVGAGVGQHLDAQLAGRPREVEDADARERTSRNAGTPPRAGAFRLHLQ